MGWFIFALGIALGAGGYFLYDKYFNKAEAAVKAEETKVKDKIASLRKKL